MSQPSPAVESQSNREADTGEPGPPQFEIPVRIVEDQQETERTHNREDRADQHDADDLQAQRDAAAAASRAAEAAEAQYPISIAQTVIAALATVVGALGTLAVLWALRLTREANKIAKSALLNTEAFTRQELRAYVSAEPRFLSSFDATHWPRARFAMKNHGHTPARNVRSGGILEAHPYPLPEDFDFPEIPALALSNIIFPGSENFGLFERNVCFSQDEIDAIRAGAHRVYLIGIVMYDDIYDAPHITRFGSSVKAPPETIELLSQNYVGELELVFEIEGRLTNAD